jgi:hypothetical protein
VGNREGLDLNEPSGERSAKERFGREEDFLAGMRFCYQ